MKKLEHDKKKEGKEKIHLKKTEVAGKQVFYLSYPDKPTGEDRLTILGIVVYWLEKNEVIEIAEEHGYEIVDMSNEKE